MAESSEIGWTDGTFNGWWGCERVSPACAHCYADSSSKRFGFPDLWSEGGERRFFADAHWNDPVRWNRKVEAGKGPRGEGVPMLVFCASMSDVFEDHPDVRMVAARERLWGLIDETPWLTWQLLTKRPENIARMVPTDWADYGCPQNVWLGTSIENAKFSWRAEAVQEVEAPVHFLSCEPLLGSLFDSKGGRRTPLDLTGIEWAIGGGESGPHFRETKDEWAIELRDAARERGIPFFWKQNGGIRPKSNGKMLAGAEWCEIPPLPPPLALPAQLVLA